MLLIRNADRLMILFLMLLHVIPLMNVVGVTGGGVARGVVPATVIPGVLALLFIAGSVRNRLLVGLDVMVGAYFLISLASGGLFILSGNPSSIGAYAYGLYHFLLPILCYFAARLVPSERVAGVVGWLILLNSAALLLTIGLHVLRPGFYANYLATQVFAGTDLVDRSVQFARMQGYLGSTAVGTVSAATVALVMAVRSKRVVLTVWTPVVIAFIAALFTLQRGGMVATAFAVVVLLVTGGTNKATRFFLPVAMVVALLFGVFRFEDEMGSMGVRLAGRASSDMVEAVRGISTERGYGPGLRYFREYPFGVGLGGTSSAADIAGQARWGQVVDANFMRILADLGLPGLLTFVGILVLAARAALRRRQPAAWLTFFGVYILIMVGTNTLDSYYVSHSFWLVLGLVDQRNRPSARNSVSTQLGVLSETSVAAVPLGPTGGTAVPSSRRPKASQ